MIGLTVDFVLTYFHMLGLLQYKISPRLLSVCTRVCVMGVMMSALVT